MEHDDRTRTIFIAFAVLALLACNAAAAQPNMTPALTDTPPAATDIPLPTAISSPVPTPTGPPTITPEAMRDLLLEEVSAERLVGHVEALSSIHTRHVNSDSSQEAARYLYEAFNATGDVIEVTYDPFPLLFNDVETTQVNVVATLAGANPTAPAVVVGAHYDSRGADLNDALARAPGANDNASGVAALLELATVLSDMELRRPVVLVAFAAEEVGSYGGWHFLRDVQLRGRPVAGVLVLDIIGNSAGAAGAGSIRVFASPEHAESQQLGRTLDVLAQVHLPELDVLLQPTADRPGRYSDHIPFSLAGIPAVRLIEPVETPAQQHTADDLPEFISPGYLRQATQLALLEVYSAAHGPRPPSITAEGDTLQWAPVPRAERYIMALRNSHSLTFNRLLPIEGTQLALTTDSVRYDLVSIASVHADGTIGQFSSELPLDR